MQRLRRQTAYQAEAIHLCTQKIPSTIQFKNKVLNGNKLACGDTELCWASKNYGKSNTILAVSSS